MILSPIVLIVCLSSASRQGVGSIIIFWVLYYYLTSYHKVHARTKVMFIMIMLAIAAFLFVSLDWQAMIKEFNASRKDYAAAIPALNSKNAWIAGLGFMKSDELFRLIKWDYMDNFYLITVLQCGLVGAILLIGAILWSTFMYFQDIRNMTKIQRLMGSFMIVFLLGGFLDCRTFGHGAIYYMIYWMLYVVSMNEHCGKYKISGQ